MFNSASILKYAESGYLLFIVKLAGFRINHQLYETTSKQNTYITTNKMKKITLIALIFSAVGVSAQQKLIGKNSVNYDEMGVVQYIDSNEFIYTSWEGSLFSNEPIFRFDGSVFDWAMEDAPIKWNVENLYIGNSLPLSLLDTYNNTIVAGNATVSQSSSDKSEFVYNAGGEVSNFKSYSWDGFSFILNYEIASQFNAAGKLSVRENIDHAGDPQQVVQIDSMFYNVGNQLIRSISYGWDGNVTLYAANQSLITYTGAEVQNIQLYEGDVVTPLTWIYDIDYIYAAGKPTNIDAYQVTNGVPSTTIFIEINYTYGSNTKISSYEGILGGDVFQQFDFVYNAQGFITELTSSKMDMNTSALYLESVDKFYYQNTADVNEVVVAEASISPNPASDFIAIKTNDEIEQIAIYSINGNVMLTQNSGDISIAHLPAGVYIAKVKTATGFAQARFVKQ